MRLAGDSRDKKAALLFLQCNFVQVYLKAKPIVFSEIYIQVSVGLYVVAD